MKTKTKTKKTSLNLALAWAFTFGAAAANAQVANVTMGPLPLHDNQKIQWRVEQKTISKAELDEKLANAGPNGFVEYFDVWVKLPAAFAGMTLSSTGLAPDVADRVIMGGSALDFQLRDRDGNPLSYVDRNFNPSTNAVEHEHGGGWTRVYARHLQGAQGANPTNLGNTYSFASLFGKIGRASCRERV